MGADQQAYLRRKVFEALWSPALRPIVQRVPLVRRIYNGWGRRHPFDVAHDVDTSGMVPSRDCAPTAAMAAHISPYAGSQPSIVRASLATLPQHHEYTFVDLGCGKGRALLVASEFPFRRVIGVEIAPALAAIARTNAARLRQRHPQRPDIQVDVGDATAMPGAGERVVYFMYHPFDGSLVRAMIASVERDLQAGLQHAFFVYYNPVHGELFDRSASFARWSAQTIAYASEELGYGTDLSDVVVIWQSRPPRSSAREGANRRIVVDPSGWSARLTG